MTGLLRVDVRTARLRRMRVTLAWRGRGVAEALLAAVEQFCRQRGYVRIVLDTTDKQVAAQRLYERNGFVRKGERALGPFRVIDYEKALR
jgi:GNAT superfamily N-acetyltransferase